MTGQTDHNPIGNPAPGPARTGGAFSPFRSPVFRAIWIANLCSNVGSSLQSVGAAWLMTELTDSNQLIALVQASVTLPVMLFGVFAGAMADNFDRRRVMLAAQVGMLVTSAALTALTYADLISPFLLLAFTLTVGAGMALNAPSWQASVRRTVEPQELQQAIALSAASVHTARTAGPALGGLIISIWDPSLAFLINTVSYLALIGVLLWWRPEARVVERRPILESIAVGLRYSARSSPIRRILVRAAAIGIGMAGFPALLPVIVSDLFKGGELDFGILLGVFGLGSIVIVPFVRRIRRRLRFEGMLAATAVIFAITLSVVAEVHSVGVAAPFAFIAGMGWVAVVISLNTAIQLRSPDEILGRCLSIYHASTFGGLAMGSWCWGAVADLGGLPLALHAASAYLIVSSVVLWRLVPLPGPGEGVIALS